jgi:hypothetical protein
MSSMVRAAVLFACYLSALVGCAPEERLVVEPGEARLLEGQTTVVVVRVEPGCDRFDSISVEGEAGGPTPAWLAVTAVAYSDSGYVIANPGENCAFPCGGGTTFDPMDFANARALSGSMHAQVTITPVAGAPDAPAVLQVGLSGCGRTWTGGIVVQSVGAAEVAGFCGWSSGEPCAGDPQCARSGWAGHVCSPSANPSHGVNLLDCADPVPTGARCGCVAGTCAWRAP